MSRTLALLLALAMLTGSAAGSRASVFEIELFAYDGSNLICQGALLDLQSAPSPVSASEPVTINDVVSNSSGLYEANAERGIVQMKMSVDHRVNSPFSRLFGSCSEVREVIDDIVVTGPPGSVTAALNAEFHGKLTVDSLVSRSEIQITVSLTALDGGGGVRDTSTNTISIDPLESGDLDELISSGSITFQTGDTLSAELKIKMSLVVGSRPPEMQAVNVFDLLDGPSDFGLHFSYDEVLTLPPGYTASSNDGDIGDNRWRGTVSGGETSFGGLKARYR